MNELSAKIVVSNLEATLLRLDVLVDEAEGETRHHLRDVKVSVAEARVRMLAAMEAETSRISKVL